MSMIQATGTATYFQYAQQSQQVRGQTQDIQSSNQNQTTDTIVKQSMAGHLRNEQTILSDRQGQSRGSVVDLFA